MIRFQVRFEKSTSSGFTHGVRNVAARSECEAIARVRRQVPGSFGHWINRLATEGIA